MMKWLTNIIITHIFAAMNKRWWTKQSIIFWRLSNWFLRNSMHCSILGGLFTVASGIPKIQARHSRSLSSKLFKHSDNSSLEGGKLESTSEAVFVGAYTLLIHVYVLI